MCLKMACGTTPNAYATPCLVAVTQWPEALPCHPYLQSRDSAIPGLTSLAHSLELFLTQSNLCLALRTCLPLLPAQPTLTHMVLRLLHTGRQ